MKPDEIKPKTYEVKFGDTWYGIAEAKYGTQGYRQTMEIVKQLKKQNNVGSQEMRIPKELTMMDSFTLKNGKTLEYKEDGEVNTIHNNHMNANHEANIVETPVKDVTPEQPTQVVHSGVTSSVVFNPDANSRQKPNTKIEISVIEQILNQNPNISAESKAKLIQYLKDGKLAFAFADIPQEYIENASNKFFSILAEQQFDNIVEQSRYNLGQDFKTETPQDEFLQNYNNIMQALEASRLPNEALTNFQEIMNLTQENVDLLLSQVELQQNQNSSNKILGSRTTVNISSHNQDLSTVQNSLYITGVLKNLRSMQNENGNITNTNDATKWMQERPEMFTKVEYIQGADGEYRKITLDDLKNLPEGYIVAYDTSLQITTKSNQIAEDFDRSKSFHVFKLNDENWTYNNETQKLEYTGPVTEVIKQDNATNANIEYTTLGPRAYQFQNAIIKNKAKIMETLNITEEQFNTYKALAQGISIVETQAGSSIENIVLDALENDSRIKSTATVFFGTLSEGMTQIKITSLSESEIEILKQFGIEISHMNDLDVPKVSALATMVHIDHLAKDYPRYMENVDSGNIGITKSIENLNETEQANLNNFITALTTEENWSKLLDVMQVLRGNKTADTEEMQNLVEGAKLFVDTYVEHLNENEYIAARWNGKRVVKPDNKNNTARLNIYYNNMLQVHIDRSRIAINNGEDVAFRPAKMSTTYSYINSVSDKAGNYYVENSEL